MTDIRTSPSGPEIATASTTDDVENLSNISGATVTNALNAVVGLRILRTTRISTVGAGTHICLSTATHARIRGSGGGGAGGGANAPALGASVGAPASGAGVFETFIPLSAGQSIPYVIGAGGVPVLGGTGGDGGDTTVTYNAVTYTAGGGLGSIASTSAIVPLILGCVAGGVAAGGDINIAGAPGGLGFIQSITVGLGGNGGANADFPETQAPSSGSSGSADGNAGQPGCGGSGAINFNNNPANGNTGGAGGDGYLVITEYGV